MCLSKLPMSCRVSTHQALLWPPLHDFLDSKDGLLHGVESHCVVIGGIGGSLGWLSVQDFSISIALAMEILQCCAKPCVVTGEIRRSFWWLSAGLQYLHCINNGDTAVLCYAVAHSLIVTWLCCQQIWSGGDSKNYNGKFSHVVT